MPSTFDIALIKGPSQHVRGAYRDGARWIGVREQEREARRKASHERRYQSDAAYREQHDQAAREKAARFETLLEQVSRKAARAGFRHAVRNYDRVRRLRFALPEHPSPCEMPRAELIAELRKRLQTLKHEHSRGGHSQGSSMQNLRVCLVAERLALRQLRRSAQAAEAA